MRFLWVLVLLLQAVVCASQTEADDYVNDKVMKYDDYVYVSNVRTVQFHETSWEYAPPVIPLHGGQQLELSFDDLEGDRKQYSVSFVHCNADWTPSDLMISEYLNGYFELNIQNFSYSSNTVQKYTHYSLVFPFPNTQNTIQFTKSGNYIVYVYLNGDKTNLILCRRFMVCDERVNLNATFRQPIGGGGQYVRQHLDFTIVPANYDITNPYRDMKVVLLQNNRWENAITGIKPTFLNGTQLVFSLDDATTFNGGNEFRYFDIRSYRFLTERVKDIYRDKELKWHAVLQPDLPRASKPYLYYSDFNGNFVIRNTESQGDPDTEADYMEVSFFMPYSVPESRGNLYIMGKLTDWRMTRSSRMTYNYDRKGYEAKMFLKQGFYNYIYVFSDDEKKGGDETLTEGNHWDTENDYMVLVYHRRFGTYYDQLIGYKKLNSLRR